MDFVTCKTDLAVAHKMVFINHVGAGEYAQTRVVEKALRHMSRSLRYVNAATTCLDVFADDVLGHPIAIVAPAVPPVILSPGDESAVEEAFDEKPKSKKAKTAPPVRHLDADQIDALYAVVSQAITLVDTWAVNLRGEGDDITSALLVLASTELDEALAKLSEAEADAKLHAFAASVGL